VARKVLYRFIGPGLIPVGIGNHGLGVIGHDELRDTTKEGQCLGCGTQPVGHGFSGRGVRKCIARRTQCRYKDVRAIAIAQAHCRASKVDEQLLACTVNLAHGAFERFGICPVVHTELA
jgi:hypothetical protein